MDLSFQNTRLWDKIRPKKSEKQHFLKKPYQNRSQDITMYYFVKIHSIWRMLIFVTKFVQKFKIKKRKNRE